MTAKKALWKSVDVNARKNVCFWAFGIWLALTIADKGLAFIAHNNTPLLLHIMFIPVGVVCEILLLVEVWMILRTLSRHKKVIFGECVLSHVACSGGHYYFQINLEVGEDSFPCYTRSIYTDHSQYTSLGDWQNKRVIAAYDPKQEIAIVIGEATEELRQLLNK